MQKFTALTTSYLSVFALKAVDVVVNMIYQGKSQAFFFFSVRKLGGNSTTQVYVLLNQLSMCLIIVDKLFLMILLAFFSVMLPYEPEPHTVLTLVI